jgi:hypothetical protein
MRIDNPTLTTPASGTLTNCTGLPASGVVNTAATLSEAQTFITNAKTFTNSLLKLLGSSTGATTFTSANAGASNFTLTFPAVTDTLAVLGANTFTGVQTMTSPVFTTPVLGTPTSGTLTNCTKDGTNGIGYLNIPANNNSANYTTVLGDAGKMIHHPSTDANARTFTIDSNANVAYIIGTTLTFVNMTSQVVTIAITSDTMYLSSAGTTGSRSLAQYGIATAVKLTSTTWLISGNGLT